MIKKEVKVSAQDILNMMKTQEFTDDIEAQYKSSLYYMDLVNYRNCNSFDPQVITRQIFAYLGLALPSLAYTDPYRTRAVAYNMNLVCQDIKSPLLVSRISGFNSDNMLLIEEGLCCGLYRLVSGRKLYDTLYHEYAQQLYDKFIFNAESGQKVCAIPTLTGRFQAMPNIMALMALELHDRFFGSDYMKIKDDVLAFINDKLRDPETGLYYEFYQTGALGYQNETIRPENAWHPTRLKASVNAFALPFIHYYEPKKTEEAWQTFKARFSDELLGITAADIATSLGQSYCSQLGPASETLCGAILAAREMGDEEYFAILQDHLLHISGAYISEGHIFYPNFGDNEHLVGHFLLFARTHVGWQRLFEHDWKTYYEYDFNKVR